MMMPTSGSASSSRLETSGMKARLGCRIRLGNGAWQGQFCRDAAAAKLLHFQGFEIALWLTSQTRQGAGAMSDHVTDVADVAAARSQEISASARPGRAAAGARRAARPLAHQDSLIDLPNRRGFLRELERLIARVSRYDEEAAMLFVDLDGLKLINDSFGHQRRRRGADPGRAAAGRAASARATWSRESAATSSASCSSMPTRRSPHETARG